MKCTVAFATFLAAIFFQIALVQARIESFYIPKGVAAGDTINVKLASSNYIQSVLDVSDFWGIQLASFPRDTFGTALVGYYLGQTQSNLGNVNITQNIHIPNTYTVGQVVSVKVALTSFYGAGLSPIVAVAEANVTIGTTTQGSNFKQSSFFLNNCAA